MRRRVLVFALLASSLALGSAAQSSPPDAQAKSVTILFHHPNDGVDPLGVEYSRGLDAMRARYGHLSDDGRFDYPFLVADGVTPIRGVPDAEKPYISLLAAYEAVVADRAPVEPAAALRLSSSREGEALAVHVDVTPAAGAAGQAQLLVAVSEDPVHYQPPAGLTNGVTEHRFTVRHVLDLGTVDLGAPSGHDAFVPLSDSWEVGRLSVAAWLQDPAGQGRFARGEVLQSAQAPLGETVNQTTRAVLLEMLSATWCDPCLYGDLAAEDVAVARGAARPLSVDDGARYYRSGPWWAFAGAVAAGGAVWWMARRRT